MGLKIVYHWVLLPWFDITWCLPLESKLQYKLVSKANHKCTAWSSGFNFTILIGYTCIHHKMLMTMTKSVVHYSGAHEQLIKYGRAWLCSYNLHNFTWVHMHSSQSTDDYGNIKPNGMIFCCAWIRNQLWQSMVVLLLFTQFYLGMTLSQVLPTMTMLDPMVRYPGAYEWWLNMVGYNPFTTYIHTYNRHLDAQFTN